MVSNMNFITDESYMTNTYPNTERIHHSSST